MKKCCRCKEEKSLESFGKSKDRKDGLNVTCLSCCSEVARSKSKRRLDVSEITEVGEIWKKLNEVFPEVHESFLISNYGRIYRQPYLCPQGSRWGGEFCKIVMRFGVATTGVRDSNPNNMKTKKISVALAYYKLFVNLDFIVNQNWLPIYHYRDGNDKNFIDGNCIVTYSLENFPNELLEVYRYISEIFCQISNSNFRFLGTRELSSISEEEYKVFEQQYNKRYKNNFFKFPKSGGGFERMVSECLKKMDIREKGILNFLKKMNVDIDKDYSNNRYISNLGSICDSNIECFVRNVYESISLIDEKFEKLNLSKIVGVSKLNYDPIPDEFFEFGGKMYISETFGFCHTDDKDKISKIYNDKSIRKQKLYQDFGLSVISLYVHGKTYQEVLSEINDYLLNYKIIKTPIVWDENLLPRSYRFEMKEELLKFLSEKGEWFTPKELKESNKKLYIKLTKFCEMNEFTVTEYLSKEIFKTDEIEYARGVPSVVTHYSHQKITQEVKNVVKTNKIETMNELEKIDSPLYWRLFRMCRSRGQKMSDFFVNELNINRKRMTYSRDELIEMFKNCRNRWDAQKKNETQYRIAKRLGVIDELFPK
jgi:hypothetical protein